MNTKPHISIILTILSILSLALAARAQNLVVSNSAVTRSGTHYENNGTANPALTVSGSLGSFTGANIILTATAASGNGRIGANLTTQGSLNLTDSTINAALYGVNISGTSSAVLNNTNINTGTTASAYGIYQPGFSTVTMTGGTIHTSGASAHGIYQSTTATLLLDNVTIFTEGATAYGINLGSSAKFGNNLTIETTGSAAHGMQLFGASVTAGDNGIIATHGNNSFGMYLGYTLRSASFGCNWNIVAFGDNSRGIYGTANNNTADIVFGDGLSVETSGSRSVAIILQQFALRANNATLKTHGKNSFGIYAQYNMQQDGLVVPNFSGTNIVIQADQSAAIGAGNGGWIQLWNSTLKASDNMAILIDEQAGSGLSRIDIHGGTVTNAQSGGSVIGSETRYAGGSGRTNMVIVIENSTLASSGDLLTVTGTNPANYIDVTLNNADATHTGGITLTSTSSGTTNVTVNGGSGINGNATNSGSGTLNLALTNSTLTGKTTVSDTATLNLSLFDSGTWYMVDNSTLTNLTAAKTARVNFPAPAAGVYHTLTVRNNLSGEGGAFAMHTDIAAGKADLLTIGGTASTGAHRIALTNANDNAITGAESPLLLVETAGGSATFTGTTTAGVYDYSVQNGSQVGDAFNLPETNWYLYRAGLSNVGNAIINTSAMLGYDWFYSLDALYLRMGDVREENLTGRAKPPAEPQPRLGGDASPYQNSSASGNLWVRARGYRLNADASLSGRPYNEYAYGLTAGADKAFHRDSSAATTLLGAFLDAGRIDRDFSGINNTGYTTSLSAGLYATYLRQNGWHADLVLKADRYKHHFDATTADQLPVTGDYSNNALGASLEIGRRLERADGWWVEPMVQAAYTWLGSATYRTGPNNATLGVTVDSTRAAQYRALVRFGRRLASSRWSPYGKFGVVRTDLNGGALHIADGANTLFVPDADGWRVEFGAGTRYAINARSQLYFDYEYDRAPHYERPWALNLGYRYGW